MASGSRSVVGMRSRASGVARLETVAASFIFNSRRFVHSLFYGRATSDARERIPTTLHQPLATYEMVQRTRDLEAG